MADERLQLRCRAAAVVCTGAVKAHQARLEVLHSRSSDPRTKNWALGHVDPVLLRAPRVAPHRFRVCRGLGRAENDCRRRHGGALPHVGAVASHQNDGAAARLGGLGGTVGPGAGGQPAPSATPRCAAPPRGPRRAPGHARRRARARRCPGSATSWPAAPVLAAQAPPPPPPSVEARREQDGQRKRKHALLQLQPQAPPCEPMATPRLTRERGDTVRRAVASSSTGRTSEPKRGLEPVCSETCTTPEPPE